MLIIALLIAFLVPPGFLFLIRTLDFHGTGKFRYNILSLLWGGIAYTLAISVNSIIMKSGLVADDTQLTRGIAPFTEEILKAAILFYLVRRADFNYVVDGAIYGFGVGIGFAMIENYQYIMGGHPDLAITLAFSRAFSTNLVHATASGLAGSVLAAVRTERKIIRIFSTAVILAVAIGIHMGFNIMVTNGAFLIIAIAFGAAGAALIVVIIKRSLKIQQAWIAEQLGKTDRVTSNEAALVNRIQSLDDILEPIYLQFGPEKAAQAGALLRKQAEIGIKHSLLNDMQDIKRRGGIQMEIEHLVIEMDSIRKAIGPYCMLFVRTVYLESGSKVWDVIKQRVTAAGSGPVGGGLWSVLDERVRESKKKERAS